MPDNRAYISDAELVQPAKLLEKGIPLPGLSGRYVVEEGHVAIITEGGAFKEILEPGTHFLDRYHFWRDIKATKVDIRIKTLTVSLIRELRISQPVPVEINLELAVEYRVSEPRRVAMEITTPLTSLYNRAIQAVRETVVHATYDEVRTQGEGIARITLQRLQAMQLPRVIGIEVFNVLVTSIKALDAGSDLIASKVQEAWVGSQDIEIQEYEEVRRWQREVAMLQGTQVTPQWLMMHRPEIYRELMAGNTAVLMKMMESGVLDPASAMSLPTYNTMMGGVGPGVMGMLQIPGMPQQAAMPQSPGYASGAGYGVPTAPQNSYGTPGASQPQLGAPHAAVDPHARMREEIDFLQAQPGLRIDTKPGADERGIADGSYDLKVQLPRISGGTLTLYITCPADYPRRPPVVEVDVDDEPMVFHSATLRRWAGQYLVEVVREARQQIG